MGGHLSVKPSPAIGPNTLARISVALAFCSKIEKNDMGRISNSGIMASEFEAAAVTIDFKNGNVVRTLIAAVEKLTGRIELKTPRIVPPCPLFRDIGELAAWTNRKDCNAVMQAVASVDKLPVVGNENLRTEIAACKTARKR